MQEKPIRAVITARFDLGFIVELPNGRHGQLRVLEMLRSTAELDRSPEQHVGIGHSVNVYVIRELEGDYLLSEFSAEERSERDQREQDWIKAQEQARLGDLLTVRIEHKREWGCICRQEVAPFLQGVLATTETVVKNQLPSQCAVVPADWVRLSEGSNVLVVIVHKRWSHWRHLLYFSLSDTSG